MDYQWVTLEYADEVTIAKALEGRKETQKLR